MKRFFCFLALFCSFGTRGQSLTIGDRLPDEALQQIERLVKPGAAGSIKPVIILDFFATWCGSCIGLLPKLEKLDQQMKDSLGILVVSPQSAREIGPLVRSRAPKLPFLGSDSLLSSLFPYRLLPHEVWIQDGIVKAITLPDDLLPANIRELLASGQINLPVKKDIIKYDPTQPFADYFTVAKNKSEVLLYGRLEGAPGGRGVQQLPEGKRHYFLNQPMLSIFRFASAVPYNLFSYDRIDSTWLAFDDRAAKKYCYEYVQPDGISDTAARSMMLTELNNAGPLQAALKKQWSDCYIISVIPGADLTCRTKGALRKVSYDSGRVHARFTNTPLSRITGEYTGSAYPSSQLPIILDETGITGNIDITIPTRVLKDIRLLDDALRPYGLTVATGKREIERLVISEKNAGAPTNKSQTPKTKR